MRRCLGRFATGVTVVTYRDGDEPRGATMNAFTSVSLTPPLVLISVARTARACGGLEGRPFAVNVLADDQLDVALQFAGRDGAARTLRWDDDGIAPHLRDALAWIECEPWRAYDGGDHVLFLGEVQRLELAERDAPLLFFAGRFHGLGEFADRPFEPLVGPEPGWLGFTHIFELPRPQRSPEESNGNPDGRVRAR